MTTNNSINLSKSNIALNGANADITSMTALSGSLKAPTFINDSNNNKVLGFSSVASAVNYLSTSNSATGNNPSLSVNSGAGNVQYIIQSKGTGVISFNNTNNSSIMKLLPNSGSNSFTVTFSIPTLTSDQTLTLVDLGTSITPVAITDSITAHSGGGQADAVQLMTAINRISTCANAGDSVKLPVNPSSIGITLYIRNDGANSCNVYPATGYTINSLGANNPYALAAGTAVIFIGSFSSIWRSYSSS